MSTHYHYIIWGYERVEPGTGNFIENAIIDVLALNEGEAIKRAKSLVTKANYIVREVIEHIDGQPCGRAA
jgi:hypothetical protein